MPGVGPHTRVLDVGCGTGLQTLLLARNSAAQIVAVDNHAPFIEELDRRARLAGISDRLQGRVGDMRQLDLPPASFDLIWSEGAIYIMGFEEGLRQWRRLLAPGGHMAVSDACWMKPGAPPACTSFWEREYPAIRDVPGVLTAIAQCGYETVGHFPLPPSAWWDDYYRPLQRNVAAFRERHRGESAAQDLADQVQCEIDVWHAFSEFYSYEFFVIRAA